MSFYKVLGVPHSATKEAISAAYRSLAKKYHPDVTKQKDAEEVFKKITGMTTSNI